MKIDHRERLFPRRAAAAALLALSPFWSGVALAAGPAAPVTVPIEAGKRQAQPLPEGDKIELSLSQAIELVLRNALDLDVASLTYQRTGFSIGSAEGAFDPNLTASLGADGNKTPPTRSFQALTSQTQSYSFGVDGLSKIGTQYSLGFGGTRNDSPTTTTIPGYVEINPTFSSGVTATVTQPLLRGFGRDVNTRLVVQSSLARDSQAWSFVASIQNAVQLVEHRPGEVAAQQPRPAAEVGDRALALGRGLPARREVEEHEPGRPAAGTTGQRGRSLRGQRLAVHLPEELLDLPRAEPQRLVVELDELARDHQPRSVRGQRAAGPEGDAHPWRPEPEQFVELLGRGVALELVDVVEHQQQATRGRGLLERAGELRDGPRLAEVLTGRRRGCPRHAGDERRGGTVLGTSDVPGRRRGAERRSPGQQRGLARAGWRDDHHDPGAVLVEQGRQQAGPVQPPGLADARCHRTLTRALPGRRTGPTSRTEAQGSSVGRRASARLWSVNGVSTRS